MSFWLLDSSSRLADFRNFRIELSKISKLEEKLHILVEKWKYVPISSRILDPYSSHAWPSPWEILYENNYDENAIAYMMACILEMSGTTSEVLFVEDDQKTFQKLIILVDDIYVLNYSYGIVEDKKVIKECKILESWKSSTILS